MQMACHLEEMKRENQSGLQRGQPGKREGERSWGGPVTGTGREERAERREETTFLAQYKLLEGFEYLFFGL